MQRKKYTEDAKERRGNLTFLCGMSGVVRKDFTEKIELELRTEAIEEKRIIRIV